VKNVTWMKDGKRLPTTESFIRIDSVKRLMVIIFVCNCNDSLKLFIKCYLIFREDKGMYQCFVRNDQDSAQATGELKLGGRCKKISYFF